MSLPEPALSNPPRSGPGEKPKFSIYTMMLVLSLLATIVACAFLVNELASFQWDWSAQGAR